MALVINNLVRLGIGPISLTVAAGECVAITGPSGTGKSLLLRAIADLDPNEGDIQADEFDRRSTQAPAWRKLVTYVASESGWWSDTVGDHFHKHDESTLGALEQLGFTAQCFDWPTSRCSTGERQRLSLARALWHEPRYLLLDEPTSGLDPANTQAVENLLKKKLDAGTGVLMITHELAQVQRLQAEHLHLEDGHLRVANHG
jgi:phosphate-transporting ATPase